MILDIIETSKQTRNLIGFNYYGSDKGFYCGYVLEYSEDFVIIQHFSKFGATDGILAHKISDIQYFETDNPYINGIQLFIKNQDKIQKQTYSLPKNKDIAESFSNLFESFIGNKEYLIKFELTDGEIYFGFIEWCDENSFSIISIDNDGLINGKSIFKFEDLKLYWIDGLESRKRQILYKSKNANS